MRSYKIKKTLRKNNNKKLLLLSAGAILIASGGYAAYKYNDTDTPIGDLGDTKETVVSSNDSLDQEKQSVTTPSRDGGAVDTAGQDSTTSSEGVSSSSGKITVYSPGSGSLIQNGSTISGASSLNTVSYRLIDDHTGVIGSGSLKVVNGKFSGKFSFSSSGKEGRLDVFRELEDGREVDIVEIAVRFK